MAKLAPAPHIPRIDSAACLRAADLEGCDDGRLLSMVHALPRDSELRELACAVLVARYQSLVRACVQPFRNSPESQEELMQVGYVGLLKAINNFDPAVGNTLAGYAQPCVSGEIKRHFRDKRWHVRVKRSLQELRLELRNAVPELTHELGRTPRRRGAGRVRGRHGGRHR